MQPCFQWSSRFHHHTEGELQVFVSVRSLQRRNISLWRWGLCYYLISYIWSTADLLWPLFVCTITTVSVNRVSDSTQTYHGSSNPCCAHNHKTQYGAEFMNIFLREKKSQLRDSSPEKKKNYLIIYWPSCSKPVWLSFSVKHKIRSFEQSFNVFLFKYNRCKW